MTDKARKLHSTTQDTPCSFAPENDEHDEVDYIPGASAAMDEDVAMELLDTSEVLKLWPWVNQVGSRRR